MDYKKELLEIKKEENKNSKFQINQDNIILYGAGSLGKMAMDIFLKSKYFPKQIIDKNVIGDIAGIPIQKPSDISQESKETATVLVTICTIPYQEIVKELTMHGIKNIMPYYTYAYLTFPELLSNGWFIQTCSDEYLLQMENVLELLAHDKCSIYHYLQFGYWKLKGIEKSFQNYPVLSGKKYFKAPCMPSLSSDEVFLDCGCHVGDSIQLFLDHTGNNYKSIYAFEPDCSNMKTVTQRFKDSNIYFDSRAITNKIGNMKFLSGLGFASKLLENEICNELVQTTTLDELGYEISILKIHVEGEELNILKGAIETIKKCRPIIMVFADHSIDGMFEIPLFLNKVPNYKIYFYLHDYCGNSAVYYMIPNERIII